MCVKFCCDDVCTQNNMHNATCRTILQQFFCSFRFESVVCGLLARGDSKKIIRIMLLVADMAAVFLHDLLTL